ncbi:MAG: hypothetical protein JSW43_02605 [Gemmatimonadota bacterium]|nr:MAG: hypothetical protein JSW43_02605 [Gemmatimonadota bacterium]
MEREVAMFLFGVVSVAMVGGFGLVGFRMWLKASSKRQGDIGQDHLERLSDAMEGMHAQLRQLHDSVSELHERMDFAERLLTKGKDNA